MNCTTRNTILFTAALMFGSTAVSSFANEGEWAKNHPRRAEVNQRLENQDKRINQEVKEGEMSKAEAAKLHKQDRHIRNEERAMASKHDGHITKQEQKKLNKQENVVSREIGK